MSTSIKVFKKGASIKNKNTAIIELVRTSKEMRKKNDLTRRAVLAGIGAGLVAVAGCSEEEETPGNEGSDDSPTPTETTPELESYVKLVDHSFEERGWNSVDFFYTLKNVSDQEMGWIETTIELYQDNERVENRVNDTSDLDPGIEVTESLHLNDVSPDSEITRYEIEVIVHLDGGDVSHTYEFTEFEVQEPTPA